MADRPLLFFPQPQLADRDKGTPVPSYLHGPSVSRQGERIGPKLQALQQAFDARTVEMRESATGIDPEQVLVIETIGTVENFARAVARVAGLEWLGESEIDEIAPDDDFYDSRDQNKPLRGRLYLLLSNQQGLREMLSLWSSYQVNPAMTFPRGVAKFRDVFLLLYDIRRWGIEDRLHETGAIDAWQEDMRENPDQPVQLEIELWFRASAAQRDAAQAAVSALVEQIGGRNLAQYVLPEIAYNALLAELPQSAIAQIAERREVELIKCDSVMFFRPVGQVAVGKVRPDGDAGDLSEIGEHPLPSGEPVIALLDGLPIENHELLKGRVRVDDPDDFTSDCPTIHRAHGTSMCSLIVHGDLNERQRPSDRPVYVRPIMKPVPSLNPPWREELPREILMVDLVHRAVRRICEGDGGEPAVASSVRVICLCIGDPSRPFFQLLSPLARLLDWLSHKYGLLFVVSAGNQTDDIDVGLVEADFRAMNATQREALVIRKLYEDARNRRLFSPAEAVNALTVGAVHGDASGMNAVGRLLDLFSGPLPSPITPFGGGHRRSVKPDLTYPGGRILYNYSPIGTTLSCYPRLAAPGQCSASPGTQPGDVRKTCHSAGTSNAAALMSRELGRCHDSLLELLESQPEVPDATAHVASLLKAMAVHGCSWDASGKRLREVLEPATDGRSVRHWVSQWLGYGVPDTSRVMECSAQRATAIGFGQLDDGEAHVFDYPLPPSLGSRTERRRLTITLAWLSPVFPVTQKYRGASLWFDVLDPQIAKARQDGERRAVRRGTVQHEVFEGADAVVISDGDTLSVKVNCRADAGKLDRPVRYAILVTLEVAPGVAIPVYEEVRTRIRPAVAINPSLD